MQARPELRLRMKQRLLLTLLVALLAAAAAVAVDRGLFRAPDAVDRRIAVLERALAESEAVRDSLDAALIGKQDRLHHLAARSDSLNAVLARLEARARLQHQALTRLREQVDTPDEHPPDALHRDLNRILHELSARPGAAQRLP